MDKLKSFIENNKNSFEPIPLPEGHEERFRQKLSFKETREGRHYLLYTLIAAACIGLVVLIAPMEWIQDQFNEAQEACETKEEFQELKIYYQMQMFDIVSEMETITQDNDSPAITGLMEAGKQVLSATERFEKNILPELSCSENGIFALNQHYFNSIECLHIMLTQMQQYTINN